MLPLIRQTALPFDTFPAEGEGLKVAIFGSPVLGEGFICCLLSREGKSLLGHYLAMPFKTTPM